jgi:hypothetical protein
VRVSHGLHRPVEQLEPHDARPDSWLQDLRAWRLVLPSDGRFTGLTAARLASWWLPPLPAELPVHARIRRSDPRPRRDGLVILRTEELSEPRHVHGLPVDPAPEVLLACAWQCALLDTVVLVDAALHVRACTLAELWECACSRRRGAPRLRRALLYADARAESAWETLLRVLHVVCDVPVEPQFQLLDAMGLAVARADLRVSGTNALHEYDGEHHLTRPQQRRDLARARRIVDQGWVRRGYTSRDVLHNAVGVLRDADLALGRPHRPERVRHWHRLLAESLFTPSGQHVFRERLGVERAQQSRSGHERHPRSA